MAEIEPSRQDLIHHRQDFEPCLEAIFFVVVLVLVDAVIRSVIMMGVSIIHNNIVFKSMAVTELL